MESLHYTVQRQDVNQRQPQERTSASQIFHVGAIFLLQLWKGDQKSKSKIDIYNLYKDCKFSFLVGFGMI